MAITPRLPGDEVLYRGKPISINGKRAMQGLQEKNFPCVSNLIGNVSKAGDSKINFFAGRWSAAKACMLSGHCRKSAEGILDSEVLSAAEADHVPAFAS